MAVFNSKPPPKVEARTHLQLGTILYNHTNNIDLAKSHLEQAVSISASLPCYFPPFCFTCYLDYGLNNGRLFFSAFFVTFEKSFSHFKCAVHFRVDMEACKVPC